MCGFAGLLRSGAGDPETLRSELEVMSGQLIHRGPDDSDTWICPDGRLGLSFRRLAILDRSPAGAQPMRSPDGRYTLVFNGEVYNFEELRRELGDRNYRGHSDTEVILHAFRQWGVRAALPRFVGMFAMALWDAEEKSLTLVRDRMGIKPLYIATIGATIGFASEVRALESTTGFQKELDADALGHYLQYLYFPAPKTPWSSVRKLPPGHLLTLRSDDALSDQLPASEPWWSVEALHPESQHRSAHSLDDRELVDALESLLLDSVGMRMIADVPLGALLSGGIDSSLVVALMQQQSQHRVRTFCIGFDDPDHNEAPQARAVAEHLGTLHTELTVGGSDALGVVADLSFLFDEPLADPSIIPTYLVSKLAREHVTVALTGDGGDELFGGYARYSAGLRILKRYSQLPILPRRLAGYVLRELPSDTLARWIPRMPGRLGRLRRPDSRARKLGRLLSEETEAEMYRSLIRTTLDPERLLRSLEASTPDLVRESLEQASSAGRHLRLDDLLLTDQQYYLPDDLLHKVDRASMAVSLEARVPLLDHRIVEFSWKLDDQFKIRDGQGKWALRAVLDRYVPRELVDRPKTGFTVPIEAWLRGPLREWARDLLFSPDPVRDALLQPNEIRRRWARLENGHGDEALGLWAILNLVSWCRSRGVQNISGGEW
jgi:asparagine synthase (glutamine-hydrolysing)